MTRTLLVAGTASHVGKSTVATGLCRRLADRGIAVAPFKAQNMSNNARAVARAVPDDGVYTGEIGVSQYVQARAARVVPTTDHNPVLLKPRGDGESQLVVDGRAVATVSAGQYYDDHWALARDAVVDAYERLAAEHDVVVAEGAGSVAEINLHHRDLANVELARIADADVLLVADIERGGVFASLVGTLELMPADLRDSVVGALVTKFRGDRDVLAPGLSSFEERTGVPVLDVLPYDDPGLPAEDSVSLPSERNTVVVGDDDGIEAGRSVTVGVPRLPRISNFTDLEPLASEPGVRVAYLSVDGPFDGGGAPRVDALVLPGTKNTVDDLLALRDAGMDAWIRAFDGPVVGLCGGYQMLGERISNAAIEGTGDADELEGLGLLPVETRFEADKRVESVTWTLDGTGPLRGGSGRVSGYEIHMGRTRTTGPAETPFRPSDGGDGDASLGAATDRILGTYLHGLFENDWVRAAFVDSVFAAAGRERPSGATETASPYDRAAALVADVDLDALGIDVAALGLDRD